MRVNISVINRQSSGDPQTPTTPTSLEIDVSPSDTVASIKSRISQLISFEVDRIRLILAGQALSENASLESLRMGPATVLHALLCQVSSSEMKPEKKKETQTSPAWRSVFYIFCKRCEGLQQGKLRVRCSICKSTAVLLKQEPSCWNDVLSTNHIPSQCTENDCAQSYAEFVFKCVSCGERGVDTIGAVLNQVKSNLENTECATCDEVCNPVVNFLCDPPPHVMCIECFTEYGQCSLTERRFRLLDPYGYTLACPVPNCDGCIRDGHHFHLLGDAGYKKYQHDATETVILGENGLFCPSAKCSAGFLLEPEVFRADQKLICCPECGHSFCRFCRFSANDCSCDGVTAHDLVLAGPSGAAREASIRHLSLSTIKNTTKACPKCKVATEKTGGCNHMACWQCGLHWCWLCEAAWGDDCQWDHWFEE